MKTLLDGLVHIEKELSEEKGEFNLFAVALREEMETVVSTSDTGMTARWDILAAASWLDPNQKSSLDLFVRKIRRHLGAEFLPNISRIVLLSPSDDLVRRVTGAVEVEHSNTEVPDTALFGPSVRRAYVISSKRPRRVVSSRTA